MNPRAACGVIMLVLIAAANLSLRQTQASTDILAVRPSDFTLLLALGSGHRRAGDMPSVSCNAPT